MGTREYNVEDIMKEVAELENQREEVFVEFDFSRTRYQKNYEESLLASVY